MLKTGYRAVAEMQFGSHIYGTNIPTSDLDFKTLFVPSARDILLGTVADSIVTNTKTDKNARNTKDDVDFEGFSLKKYLMLLMEGQTVALDMLFTPDSFHKVNHPVWQYIRQNKHRFLHRGCTSFVGYCRQQANKYGLKGSRVTSAKNAMEYFASKDPYTRLVELKDDIQKTLVDIRMNEKGVLEGHIQFVLNTNKKGVVEELLEVCDRMVPLTATCKTAHEIFTKIHKNYGERAKQAASNENVDRKAIMHAVRVCETAKELLMTGHVTFPRPEKDLLLKIRTGELEYKKVEPLIEQGLLDVEECSRKSILPEQPDREFAHKLISHVYSNVVRDDERDAYLRMMDGQADRDVTAMYNFGLEL